jgi:predicted transcriptional regulator
VHGFGDLEAVVMDLLWSWNRQTTVREVVDALQQHRRVAYTTVMTVMDHLYRKGAVVRELDGRAYRYRSAYTREEYVAAVLGEVLQSAQDRTAALLGFVDTMDPTELDALRQALARRLP